MANTRRNRRSPVTNKAAKPTKKTNKTNGKEIVQQEVIEPVTDEEEQNDARVESSPMSNSCSTEASQPPVDVSSSKDGEEQHGEPTNPTEPSIPDEGAAESSWRDKVAINREPSRCGALSYIPPKIIDGKIQAQLLVEEVAKEKDRWQHTVLGYVLGAFPSYGQIKGSVDARWTKVASPVIYP